MGVAAVTRLFVLYALLNSLIWLTFMVWPESVKESLVAVSFVSSPVVLVAAWVCLWRARGGSDD
jgi:hypothetical protein